MSGVRIDVTIDDKEVLKAFRRLSQGMSNSTGVMWAIGSGLVSSTQRRFASQTAPDGSGWAANNPAYAATKKNSRILTETGRLRGSITRRAGNGVVVVGTNVKYAAIHQLGGTITPKSKSHLVFRLGSGVVRAKSVTIPPRPFLGISDEDKTMISDVVYDALARHTK